jgi:L-2-hydroxyglutarate oxidase LhgO
MADVEVTVIGAGMVGLAIAARLAPRHPDLLVLERNTRPGQETSSRNSEVVHAGIYYPTGSLKARLCVEGRDRLYEIAANHDLPCRRLGKIVVATEPDEVPALERLHALGTANGVRLGLIDGAAARALEPHVPALCALDSPDSGVLNAHAFMDHFVAEARAAGAWVRTEAEVVEVERRTDDYRLAVRTPEGTESFTTERVVNAAGLEADRVAALAGIDVDAAGYRLHYWKGSYFSLAPSRWGMVSRLVYPVPRPESLGVHAVVDVAGRLRFGPDAEYLADRRADYRVDPDRRGEFARGVRRLLPDIRDEELEPDIAGVRPKLQGPGDPARDFVIVDEASRGLPGLVNLVGIDSPGLTSAPAIARYVEALLDGA